jgi:hypothetical protein
MPNLYLNLDQILTAIDRRLEEIRDISSRLLDDDIPDWEDSELAWEEERLLRLKQANGEYGYWKR